MVKEIETIENFVEFITNKDISFTVIDFFADWCGPCKKIAPFVDKLADKYPTVSFCKINADRKELAPVCEACKVSALPTFCFFRAGKYVTNITGANERNLENKIVELLEILNKPKN